MFSYRFYLVLKYVLTVGAGGCRIRTYDFFVAIRAIYDHVVLGNVPNVAKHGMKRVHCIDEKLY